MKSFTKFAAIALFVLTVIVALAPSAFAKGRRRRQVVFGQLLPQQLFPRFLP